MRRLSCLGAALLFSACSSGPSLDFTTDGVIEPAGTCAADPSEFAIGENLGSYGEGSCTVHSAWRISALKSVSFSQPAVVNCATANSFNSWFTQVVQPAAQSKLGSRISQVDIAASFACRPRNGVRGAKLSEHGFGNAIDVSGFTLADGRHISVEGDYYSSPFLKQIREEACGTFHTVLGPGSDSSHRDHLHFDLAERRSGQTFCH